MLPSVTGLSLGALCSPVPIGVDLNRPLSTSIAKMYVHTDDGQIHEIDFEVQEEVGKTGTYVRTTGFHSVKAVLQQESVQKIRLLGGGEYLIFTIENPEELHKLHNLGSRMEPITLETKYGAKVEFAPYGGRELRITVA